MDFKSLLVVVALLGGEYLLKKKFPKVYQRLALPALVLYYLLMTVFCGFLLYSVYVVLVGSVSTGQKVGFTIYIALCIAILAASAVISWKRRQKR